MTRQLKQTIIEYLKGHNTLTLATTADGRPWAAALFYASDDLTLYFLSDPQTRHAQNIATNSMVSATVNEDPDDWHKITGVQIEGRASLLAAEAELTKAVSLYVAKFPFTANYLKLIMSPLPKIVYYLDDIIKRLPLAPHIPAPPTKFYKVETQWVRFIVNSKGFGHKEEMKVEEESRL